MDILDDYITGAIVSGNMIEIHTYYITSKGCFEQTLSPLMKIK